MALVLSLRVGEEFYVGDERVIVRSIESPTRFVLERAKDKTLFDIVDGRAVEIFQTVYISLGVRGQYDLARVAIEAPRSVRIMRPEHYLAEHKKG